MAKGVISRGAAPPPPPRSTKARRPSVPEPPAKSKPAGTRKAAVPARSTATRAAPARVKVFLSYRHDDRIIATTLRQALIDINRDRVDCFLDCESINIGDGWEKVLDNALVGADWLISIYTGEQSEYCGYEIGVFTRAKAEQPTKQDYRLVCLHEMTDLPGLFRGHQNAFVATSPSSLVASPANVLPSAWSTEEVSFYRQSEVFNFLAGFCSYRGLYVPRDPKENDRQRELLLDSAKRITKAFEAARSTDVKSDTPTQLTLEVSFTPDAAPPAIKSVPGTALVTGTFGSFALFGLMPAMSNRQLPSTTWDELRAASSSRSIANALWMRAVEREMVNVANGKLLGAPEAVFQGAQGTKIYRPILVRYSVLFNLTSQFRIVFVETLPRQFVGYQKTSLLLAGLVQASRFRFAYLEEPDRVAALFADAQSDLTFAINCQQLHYDIERIQSEAVEFGLLDSNAFVDAFGEKRRAVAESFIQFWGTAKEAVLADLPAQGEPLSPQGRNRAKLAIATFLASMAAENQRFVITALDAYRDEVVRSGTH